MKLAGKDAIEYAAANGLLLKKHNDPLDDAREGLTPAEARKVASEDPTLIYIEIETLVSGDGTERITLAVDAKRETGRDNQGGVWHRCDGAGCEHALLREAWHDETHSETAYAEQL